MKVTTAASILAAAGSVCAGPLPHFGTPFDLITLKSGTDLQYASISASKGQLLINFLDGKQHAKCRDGKKQDTASFFLSNDGHMFLYGTGTDAGLQQVYVDQSPKGRGKMGYVAGNKDLPKNVETTGWENHKDGDNTLLYFKDTSFLACPNGPDGSHVLFFKKGHGIEGDLPNCKTIDLLKSENENAASCVYTQ